MNDTSANERREVLLKALTALEQMQQKLENEKRSKRAPIAIIGIGCRFPGGVNSPEAYWEFVKNGGDGIIEIPSNRWDVDAYFDSDPEAPGKMYTRSGGFLDEIDRFDAQFFGIAPREAASMDPQQRLLLEVSWHALENAGYTPAQCPGTRTGVYVGITVNDYGYLLKSAGTRSLSAYSLTGNHLNFAAGRIAYTYGFQGPTMAVDTACSSSLVTVHLACQQLRNDECDFALAAGVNLILSPMEFIAASKARMLSADGRCKTFDARADGFGRGEGCGVLVLKRLADALRDGDHIHAVIRGSAVNQDGASSGLTVPNALAQEALIRQALENADISPSAVQYIEAHGTGTSLGDPIEISAINAVFARAYSRSKPLLLGSVKTNIGHLESAAGVAGIIKVVMALKNKQLPGNLHFSVPNPLIDWDNSCVRVLSALTPWPEIQGPRIAGVSSFGASGTNAHVILEAAAGQNIPASQTDRPLHLLALSAQSPKSLADLQQAYAETLEKDPLTVLPDLCYSANTGRRHFELRRVCIAATTEELNRQLRDGDSSTSETGAFSTDLNAMDNGIVFLFTGQGSQYAGMGMGLYRSHPGFRKIMDRCDELFREHTGASLIAVLDPGSPEFDADKSILNQTRFTQPALFALEYALFELWRSWGIEPAAVLGHSVGEYVAACAAGVLSLEDGFKLISARARLMQELPAGGSMAAVLTDEKQVSETLAAIGSPVEIAALNSPFNVVITGPEKEIRMVSDAFAQKDVSVVPLNVSHAFHSSLMTPMLAEFGRVAESVSFHPPVIPLIANVTGRPFSPHTAMAADYWIRHIRHPVRFQDSMHTLFQSSYRTFLELGPHPVLSGMGAQCLQNSDLSWLCSLKRGNDDWRTMLSSLGRLYRSGAGVDWVGFDQDFNRRRMVLPPTPFQRKRYWLKTAAVQMAPEVSFHPLLTGGLRSPLQKEMLFESRVSPSWPAYLGDHRITDLTIAPAALYLEAAAGAARRIFGGDALELKDILFRQAVCLDDSETVRLQLLFDLSNGASMPFKLIRLASGRRDQESSWTLIASGSAAPAIVPQTAVASGGNDLECISERCPREISGDAFYLRLEAGGYQFGSAFRGVRRVRLNDREALGLIELPVELSAEVEQYVFHPALLDACIQTAAALWFDESTDRPYLPVSVDRVRYLRPPEMRLWSHAVLDGGVVKGGAAYTVNITVWDDYHNTVVEMTSVVVKRATRDALRQAGSDDLARWLYQVAWRPKSVSQEVASANTAQFIPDTSALAEEAGRRIAGLDRELNFSLFAAMFHELDRLCSDFIFSALKKLGWQPEMNRSYTADALSQTLGVIPNQRRFFGRLMEILSEDGLLQADGTGYRPGHIPSNINAEARCQAMLNQFSFAAAEIRLTAHIGRNLAEALNGSLNPLALLFPDGSTEMTEKLYRDSPYLSLYNQIVRNVVVEAQSALPAGNQLKILEIGAGTGGTTSHLLPHLNPQQTLYTFSDISQLFLGRAKKRFEAYPFVQYKLLDIEADPGPQQFEDHSFDVVIGANVLHATNDLRLTLTNVRQLLAPGGLLVLLEGARPQRFADIIVGLTEGWWKFTDTDLRPAYPLINHQQWKELLTNCSFSGACAVQGEGIDQDLFASQAIILAKGPPRTTAVAKREDTPETVSRTHYLIYADQTGVGAKLAEILKTAGHSVRLVFAGNRAGQYHSDFGVVWPGAMRTDPSDREAFDDHRRGLIADTTASLKIIYLWGLDYCFGSDKHIDTMEQSVKDVLCGALHLFQSLAAAQPAMPARVFLATRNGLRLERDAAPPCLPQHILWGFGRAAILEHPELNCTLIDLPQGSVAQGVDALYREISADDDEQQVAWRQASRFVARLAPTQPLRERADGELRLENNSPGLLDGLALVPVEEPVIEAHQVRIRVRASGLNFRDVLMALGAYPDIDTPLGIECSGKIEAAGADVYGFQVGDDVIAVAPGCLGTTVAADHRLTVKMPADMTFEQAAAIPSIYLTAHHSLIELARLKSGERVLIHAATGGVGWAAVQVARHAGAKICATAGSEYKRGLLKSMGVDHVFDSRSLAFANEIMAATNGEGVKVVLNSLSGEFIAKSFSVLAHGGRFVEIGRRDIWTDDRVRVERPDVSYYTVNLLALCQDQPTVIQKMLSAVVNQVHDKTYPLPPTQTFFLDEARNAFRFMAQAKHIGKIIISQPTNQRGTIRSAAHARASYLITGGLNGLGLLSAQWLARRGAKHIILMGRSQASDDALRAIHQMETSGCRISVIQGDVARPQDLQKVLTAIDPAHSLKGVLHCAGALSDGVLVKQSWERFAPVLAAKVSGSWNLHQLVAGMPLDFFVMFSSAVSVLGSAGQANHAAACAFQDALAEYRKGLGLPAVSINWGPWSEIGAAADRQIGERWAAQGIYEIPPEKGLQFLEEIVTRYESQIAVLNADWSKYYQQRSGAGSSAFLSELAQATEPKEALRRAQVQIPELLSQLSDAGAPDRAKIINRFVSEVIKRVLDLEPDFKIEPKQGFADLGMDSLLSIELRNHLQRGTGLSFPATLAFDYPTAEALGDLIRSMLLQPTHDHPGVRFVESARAEAATHDEISNLSEEDAQSMLLKELGIETQDQYDGK